MDYFVIVKTIVNHTFGLKMSGADVSDEITTMANALKKYGLNIDEVSAGVIREADYRKVILQILADLRYSKGTNHGLYMTEDYRMDNLVLHEITYVIEKITDEFNDPKLDFINIAGINHEDYREIVEKYQLIG